MLMAQDASPTYSFALSGAAQWDLLNLSENI